MNLDKARIEIEIFWRDFETLLQKSDNLHALALFNKLVRISNKSEERKGILFCLLKSFSVSKGRFSIKILKKYLKLLNLEHLENKIILRSC